MCGSEEARAGSLLGCFTGARPLGALPHRRPGGDSLSPGGGGLSPAPFLVPHPLSVVQDTAGWACQSGFPSPRSPERSETASWKQPFPPWATRAPPEGCRGGPPRTKAGADPSLERMRSSSSREGAAVLLGCFVGSR